MKYRTTLQNEKLPVRIVWTIIGGAALAISSVGLLRNLKEVKRLIQISRM